MGKHIAMLENMKPDDKEQDEYNRERYINCGYTYILEICTQE